MINKKYMNYVKKELKKNNHLIIRYFPNSEEINYLKKFNIEVEKVIIKHKAFVADLDLKYDLYYDVEYCKYTLI